MDAASEHVGARFQLGRCVAVSLLVSLLLVDSACAHPHFMHFDKGRGQRKLFEEDPEPSGGSSSAEAEATRGSSGVWHPNPSAPGFGVPLKHRDRQLSPHKRSFQSRQHQIVTYLKEDRLRGAHLKSRVLDRGEPHDDGRRPYDFNQLLRSNGRKLLESDPDAKPTATGAAASDSTYKLTLNNAVTSIGNHYVDFEIGTPPIRQSLVFDTGSDLIWVQCKCISCHLQADPLFVPAKSTSYSPVPCNSPVCLTREVQGSKSAPNCSRSAGTQCPYNYRYLTGASRGLLAYETMTLGDLSVSAGKRFKLENAVFGCGRINEGFDYASGVLGMGRTYLSLPNQLEPFYNNIFSSCMVPEAGTITSQVVFGEAAVPQDGVEYTPLLTNPKDKIPAFYYVQVVRVFVGPFKTPIKNIAFDLHRRGGGGTIFDTGTTYGLMYEYAWWPIFKQVVKRTINARKSPPFENGGETMWPCWEYNENSLFPAIELQFTGNTSIVWGPDNYLVEVEPGKACVSIQPTESRGNILGGSLQEDWLVVWDRKNERLGLRLTDCVTGEAIVE